MKRLLLILILTLSFQSWTKADDISDFEIEGVSEEKKMIGKYKQPEPIKLDLSTVTKGRLLLQQMREDDKRLEEQRKKIFEKKQSDENIGGLAYLLNTKT